MSRIRRGWELTKKSWALVRGHKALNLFPLYGALAMLPALAVAVVGIILIDTHDYGPGVALVAVGLFIASFLSIYFGVALAATADRIFHGQEATIGDGMRVAGERKGKIAGWAALATTVGLLLAALEYTGRWAAILVGSLINAAWGLITFLAIPVIAFEDTGPAATLKRSASLFRERWGAQVTGNVAIGGIIALLGVLPAVALVVVGIILWVGDANGTDVAIGAILLAAGVVLFSLANLLLRTLNGVFGVALYRFAAAGEATGPFTSQELESAVRHRDR
jgi:hypothetical protein